MYESTKREIQHPHTGETITVYLSKPSNDSALLRMSLDPRVDDRETPIGCDCCSPQREDIADFLFPVVYDFLDARGDFRIVTWDYRGLFSSGRPVRGYEGPDGLKNEINLALSDVSLLAEGEGGKRKGYSPSCLFCPGIPNADEFLKAQPDVFTTLADALDWLKETTAKIDPFPNTSTELTVTSSHETPTLAPGLVSVEVLERFPDACNTAKKARLVYRRANGNEITLFLARAAEPVEPELGGDETPDVIVRLSLDSRVDSRPSPGSVECSPSHSGDERCFPFRVVWDSHDDDEDIANLFADGVAEWYYSCLSADIADNPKLTGADVVRLPGLPASAGSIETAIEWLLGAEGV